MRYNMRTQVLTIIKLLRICSNCIKRKKDTGKIWRCLFELCLNTGKVFFT